MWPLKQLSVCWELRRLQKRQVRYHCVGKPVIRSQDLNKKLRFWDYLELPGAIFLLETISTSELPYPNWLFPTNQGCLTVPSTRLCGLVREHHRKICLQPVFYSHVPHWGERRTSQNCGFNHLTHHHYLLSKTQTWESWSQRTKANSHPPKHTHHTVMVFLINNSPVAIL